MIKVIDYDPSITRCDPPEKIRYDRTDFIADTEVDINAMNSSNSKYLNYPAGSSVLCLGNGKWYLLNAECNEYLEFKEGGSTRTKANLYRSTLSENGSISVTVNGETVDDGVNALNIGDTVTVIVTADSGYRVKTITLNGEEIENNSEITVEGDILLIAEFEEAPEPSEYIFNENLTFTYSEEHGGYIASSLTDVADKIDPNKDYLLTFEGLAIKQEYADSAQRYFEDVTEDLSEYGITKAYELYEIFYVGSDRYSSFLVRFVEPAVTGEQAEIFGVPEGTHTYIIIVDSSIPYMDFDPTIPHKVTIKEAPAPSAE